ncbi:MAG: sugar ABC transporter permease, partial [Chloroflexi bacterium]|nr:sugar ABC transporter permease [Chloroflexota bacterium]
PALILVAIWRTVPYFMIIVLAGLQAIPRDYYEAAALDGANRWQTFRHITLPLLRPTLVLMVVISVLMAMKVFINPLVMTGGGPSGASRVLPLLIYETGFQYFKMGLASAMSVFLFVGVMIFTLVQFRLFRHSTDN